jgi:hypothetical protein
MLNSRGQYIPEDVVPKNDTRSGLDAGIRKLLFPEDPRGTRGIIARGKPIYKGGLPSPTNPGMDSKTGVVASNPYQRLAQLRLKGII